MWPATMLGAGPITESEMELATELRVKLVIDSKVGPATELGTGPVIEPRAELTGAEKSSVPIVICHNYSFQYKRIA